MKSRSQGNAIYSYKPERLCGKAEPFFFCVKRVRVALRIFAAKRNEMLYKRKAYGIIQREDGALLLFREIKEDKSTDVAQFPGGTIDDGEAIEDGLLREMFEETGLSDILIVRQLGCSQYLATEEVVSLRHFYLLKCNGAMQDSWIHYEMFSSEHDHPLPYQYNWVTREEAALVLGADHQMFLCAI